jgi:hypothetical protein
MSDATWIGSADNDWNLDSNWTPQTVPNGTATFGSTSFPTVTFSQSTIIETLLFNAPLPAPVYIFNLSDQSLNITGLGIVDSAGTAPTLNVSGSSTGSLLEFDNTASAGDAIINNTLGATTFTDFSSGGGATITNSGGTLSFTDNSTAGGAFVTTNAGSLTQFTSSSDAGTAQITTNNGGTVQFSSNGNGAAARFVTNAGGSVDFSGTSGPNGLNQISAGSIAGAGDYSLGGNQLTVGGNDDSTTISGVIADGGTSGGTGASLVKAGTGTLLLDGTNTYTGGTTVSAGTLGGTGSVGAVNVGNGGTVAPGEGAGIFHTGNVGFTTGASFAIELGGTTVGTQYDQLQVTGTVNLGGATLSGSLLNGYTPSNGDSFVIVTGTGGISSTFAGIADNGFTGIGGHAFQVDYQSNNVVLTAVPTPPATLTGLGPSVTFAENTVNTAAQVLDSVVDFTDPIGSFNNSTLTVAGLLAEDVVSIRNQGSNPGEIGFDGDSLVSYGGTFIGTTSGGAGGSLVVNFNAAATEAAVDALIQNLTYFNNSDTPTASRTLKVTVVDAEASSTGDIPITVNVTAENDAPVVDLNGPFNGVDNTASFTEQSPVLIAPLGTVGDPEGDNLMALTATLTTRPDGSAELLSLNGAATTAAVGLTVTYTPGTGVLSITGSADQAHYQSILQGVLYSNTSDAPSVTSRIVNVTLSDGADTSVVRTVTIGVTAVNDAPVITSDGGSASATLSVAENTPAVTMVTATDPDGTAPSFTISGGADAAKFAINSSTGALTFITAPDFENPSDADHNNSYLVTVRASDGSLFDDQAITVNVTNVSEAPIIISNGGGAAATVAMAENTTAVTTVMATDSDGTTSSFAISGGADQAQFQIDTASGALSFVTAPNFEAPADADGNNSYIVQVRASDGTLFDDQAITVNVTNVNEFTPVITSNGAGDSATVSVAENTSAVTTVAATDADGTALGFTISGGADAGRFTINATTGALAFIAAPNFEVPGDADHNNSYIVQVRASDGTLFDTQTITVNVTDVSEAVTIARPVDFNADSFDDLLWRTADGGVSVWTYEGGLVSPLPTLTGSAPLSTAIEGTGDFNGDGHGDILFHSADGHMAEWLMNGNQLTAARDVGTINVTSHVAGTGDFNGDHTDDILFRNDNGQVVTWSMQGGNLAAVKLAGSAGANSHIQGTGDFNGDGRTDILFRNDDGHVALWLMNNGQASTIVDIGSAPASAHISGTGDFNGDGQTDILFRGNDGHVIEWLMTSGHIASTQDVGSADLSWNILGTGDLNGDGREDILWDNGNGHVTAAWLLNNAGQLTSAQDIGHTPAGTQIGGSHFDLV